MTPSLFHSDKMRNLSPEEREERLIVSFDEEAVVVAGIVRWKSNGEIPPQDVLALWYNAGKDFNYETSSRLRAEQEEADLAELISRRPLDPPV